MSLLGQSGVTGGRLDPCNVHALFVNMDNVWMERFGNYDCLVSVLSTVNVWWVLNLWFPTNIHINFKVSPHNV